MRAPTRVGPYRVETLLGSGGMGAVYRGFDERLDRAVALKQVKPDLSNPRIVQRFRREARAVARLNHPAVVQVYDIVETDDGDWIVMELVEGKSLAHRLQEGSVDFDRALLWAQEITAGLDEAHRRGIIHRDLKTENVLITEGGHAKILDFGLAKDLSGDESMALSVAGVPMGTVRSMSPEQAMGKTVDPRTDLFSLGVLLYETFTGTSPFLADSSLETLTRIAREPHEPARSRNPELPLELERLLDRLLEKRPDDRPDSATAVADELERLATDRPRSASLPSFHRPSQEGSRPLPLSSWDSSAPTRLSTAPDRPIAGRRVLLLLAIVLVAATGGVLLWRSIAEPPPPLYVAVTEPVLGEVDEPGAGLVAAGVRLASLRSLLSFDEVRPLPPDEVDAVTGSSTEVARATAADEVLGSRLDCAGSICRVTLSRFAGTDGSVLWTGAVDVPSDDFRLLEGALLQQLAAAYPERTRAVDLAPVDDDVYGRYLEVRRALEGGAESVDRQQLLTELRALRAEAPSFVEPYLTECSLLRLRHAESRAAEDLVAAETLARQAGELAPDDPRPVEQQFDVLVAAGRLDEAEEALTRLRQLQPADARTLGREAQLLEARGEGERALETMARATALRPSWPLLFNQANLAYRLGDTATAREVLEQLLERAPSYFPARSLLAQIELLEGSPRRAAELYTVLVGQQPGIAELSNLGLAQLMAGDTSAAIANFRRALELAPRNPSLLLNVADALSLADEDDEAEALYRTALAVVDEDPAAAEDWQSLLLRAQAHAHLSESRQAITAIQEALRQAPDNPQVHYSASLVYTLLSEHSSALVHAERAAGGGFGARWFGFSWFDPIRAQLPESLREG